MSAIENRKFMDIFTLVVGVLAGIAVGIYFLSSYISARTQDVRIRSDAVYRSQISERLAPVGKVAIAGKDNSALDPPPVAAAQGPVVSAEELPGEAVYQMACVLCHGAGIAGAPKFGDKEAWTTRLAKGLDVLHRNSLQGFQGTTGVMPPKGGRIDLSDASILNGVDYMVEAVR